MGWHEPPGFSFEDSTLGHCEGIKYENLWYSVDKERQADNNACFVVYQMNIDVRFRQKPRISDEIVTKYAHIAAFRADMHFLYIRAQLDPSWKWFPLPFRVSDDYIEVEIASWIEG